MNPQLFTRIWIIVAFIAIAVGSWLGAVCQ